MVVLPFVFYFVVAAVCAVTAERFAPGIIPGGVFSSTVLATLGAWGGSIILGPIGPDLYGNFLLPGSLCAVLVVMVLLFLSSEFKRRRA